VSKRTPPVVVSFFAVLIIIGCRASAPKNAGETITLMTKYSDAGRYDDAIKLAQNWLKGHPDDNGATFYEQIAITYLMKASKDPAHRDEWIQQSIVYYDRDLSVHQNQKVDIELYTVGRGFEAAGDLSTANRCQFYARAVQLFEEEIPFVQGDSFTAYGTTIPLAPVRQENEKALQRVRAKVSGNSCT
jgi:hypothetical protein